MGEGGCKRCKEETEVRGSGRGVICFRQKTAYEITPCLVGSEMWIRDRAASAVNPIYNALSQADVLHCDETGCRLNAKRHWLHVASNSQLSYYHIDAKRGLVALENIGLLSDYTGNLIHDCLSAYFHFTKCKHGICNAHILRQLIYS